VVGRDLGLQGRDLRGEDGGFFAEIGLDGDAVRGGLDFRGGLLEGGDLVLQGADLGLLVGDGDLCGGCGFAGGLVEVPKIGFAGSGAGGGTITGAAVMIGCGSGEVSSVISGVPTNPLLLGPMRHGFRSRASLGAGRQRLG
jgi:hypothetical protein